MFLCVVLKRIIMIILNLYQMQGHVKYGGWNSFSLYINPSNYLDLSLFFHLFPYFIFMRKKKR